MTEEHLVEVTAIIARPTGQGLCAKRNEIFLRVQACTNLPPPIGESEDLDVLGDLENVTTASTRTPPPQYYWQFCQWVCVNMRETAP